MIASVRGTVAAVSLQAAVVEVGGVGLRVLCTPSTLAGLRVGQQTSLSTALVVREDSMTLFAFRDDDERDMFELVQSASGIGPKVAQAMLAVHGPDQLRRAIAGADLKALTQVPGIGQKGAQRIVLELKDRIGVTRAGVASGQATGTSAAASHVEELVEALVGLGWSAREAARAVDSVTADHDASQPPDLAALLKAALRTLSRA
ncbi:MAG: Holliday junction branch migration protein RuvA [Nocardioidaceae bacterium]|nr:Holliday junction branch migration protein RuvA [Nocardioidaceae bacterium]